MALPILSSGTGLPQALPLNPEHLVYFVEISFITWNSKRQEMGRGRGCRGTGAHCSDLQPSGRSWTGALGALPGSGYGPGDAGTARAARSIPSAAGTWRLGALHGAVLGHGRARGAVGCQGAALRSRCFTNSRDPRFRQRLLH